MLQAPVVREPLVLSVDLTCECFMLTARVPEAMLSPGGCPPPPDSEGECCVMQFRSQACDPLGWGAVPDPHVACSIEPPETRHLQVAFWILRKVLCWGLPSPRASVVPAAPRGPGDGLRSRHALEQETVG